MEQKIGYAYLVADLFHTGHLKHLKKAKENCDILVVGCLTDKATMEMKPKPILPYEERANILQSCKYVDLVIPQYTYSPLGNVKFLKPDILFESEDHKQQPANQFIESYGGKVIETPYYKPLSSTKIKQKICKYFSLFQ